MFQSSSFEYKHPQIHTNDNQGIQDASLRQKLHRLLADNFQLREIISRMEKTLQVIEEQKRSLKQQLRIALEQMIGTDKLINSHKNAEMEFQSLIKKLQLQVITMQHELSASKQAVQSLWEHNQNLQAENKLIVQMKQRYHSELAKANQECDYQKRDNERIQANNDMLSAQITKLLGELNQMQRQISCRRQQLEDYESFVLQKVGQAKVSPEIHQICNQEYGQLYAKYIKYKKKSHNYKHERDQMQQQLELVSKQMDSSSLRKYFREVP